MAGVDPVVGQWYRRLDQDEAFRVVGVSESENLIELELADGRRRGVPTAAWADLNLEVTEQPAESPGRPEDLESDDLDHME